MDGKIKGDTLVRIWRIFVEKGHDKLVESRLPPGLSKELASGFILATEWYPIDLYLALYGALFDLTSYDEVVATAHQSVMRGLTQGTWKVFVPMLAGLAPTAFAERAAKRFEIVYKVTFEPGDARVTLVDGGADIVVSGAPWGPSKAWRAAVTGGLLSITALAKLKGECHVFDHDDPPSSVRFELRWRKA